MEFLVGLGGFEQKEYTPGCSWRHYESPGKGGHRYIYRDLKFDSIH